jgi:L-alanine-DL-glutamate epimerase-like enolase superfamily enzyme
MRITKVETIRTSNIPRWVWVQIHTDSGLIGLGESTAVSAPTEAHILAEFAPYLIGKDPMQVAQLHEGMQSRSRIGPNGSAEWRAISAVDLALWDIVGQATNAPIYQALGGKVRDSVPIYNTCADWRYAVRSGTTSWGLSAPTIHETPPGKYDDLQGFLNDAGSVAESLLDEGIKAMKIWPFDQFVPKTNGQHISAEDVNKGMEPFRKIRERVGNKIEVMAELHGMWNIPSAVKIVNALEEVAPYWVEDVTSADNVEGLRQVQERTHLTVLGNETLASAEAYLPMLSSGAIRILMFDTTFVGGFTEARKVMSLAEAQKVPATPHDCNGPVNLFAGIHLCMHAPNAFIQETTRAFIHEVYGRVVDRLPRIQNGIVYAPTDPGIGTALRADFLADPATVITAVEG